ncbi:MAG: transglutaminase family protein [Pseudomonadota bacterium]
MPIFRVEHSSHYHYPGEVGLNYGEARLLPRDTPGQTVLDRRLELNPRVDDQHQRDDPWGNRVAWFCLRQPHRELTVTAVSRIARRRPGGSPGEPVAWESVADTLAGPAPTEPERQGDWLAARECRLASPLVPLIPRARDYVSSSFPPDRPLDEALADLCARIQADYRYQPYATGIDTPISEVLEKRHGVCQDFAHLALAGLRGLGLAARYVSGYLETTPPEGQPRLEGADASHAWIAVWHPDGRWLDFDPTNGSPTGEGHLTLAWGRDYADVAPLKGVIVGGGSHRLEVGVTVTREP